MRNNPITVRLAVDSEADLIRQMVAKDYDIQMSWDRVFPYWLVAEDKSGILACVMLIIGHPFGAIEFLSFRAKLPATRKALAVKRLALHALATLKGAGCAAAFGMVPDGVESWRNVLKRHWKATMGRQCNVFWKGLR